MIVLGIDIGGKSRNGLTIMNDNYEVLDYEYVLYDSDNPLSHRKKLISRIDYYTDRYKIDYIIIEQIKLYRGRHISKLSNILSLARIQTSIINRFSHICNISEVNVQTWKSRILGNKSATKDDSINYVETNYPDIELDLLIKHKRKDDEIIKNHDLADSVCIARFAIDNKDYLDEHKLNYL